jgi:glyoxylase-like metal-dependent hydrolase (beta-lactamase superfamily II)
MTQDQGGADAMAVTGDTVLGRSAPVILDPDGRVDQMIGSLERIRRVRIRRPVEATVRAHLRYLSDHGGLSSPVQIDG